MTPAPSPLTTTMGQLPMTPPLDGRSPVIRAKDLDAEITKLVSDHNHGLEKNGDPVKPVKTVVEPLTPPPEVDDKPKDLISAPVPQSVDEPEIEPTIAIKHLATGMEMPLPMVADGYIDGRFIAAAKLKVYDPGFRATAVIRSSMTQIDGEAGILRYRGYPIDQLVKLSFLEVVFLLNHGSLPTEEQIQTFTAHIYRQKPEVDATVGGVIRALGPAASPMLAAGCAWTALGAVIAEHDPNRINDAMYFKRDKAAANSIVEAMLSAVPSIYAHIFDCLLPGHANGRISRPAFDMNLGYAENFAKLLKLEQRSGLPFEEVARALNTIWILQADHEVTASTAAVLGCASTLVTPYAAFAAGICTGYGALHGGAIDVAFAQLSEIGSPAAVPAYIERVKRKEIRLFGFGHRLYRVEDPRSKIIRALLTHLQTLREAATGQKDYLVEVALALEAAALQEEYFIKRRLAPNADFFGALVYHTIGIPGEFGLTMASIARSAGAACHWREAMTDGEIAIWRPGQIFEKGATRTGEAPVSVVY